MHGLLLQELGNSLRQWTYSVFSRPNGKAIFYMEGWVDGWMKSKLMNVKLYKVSCQDHLYFEINN